MRTIVKRTPPSSLTKWRQERLANHKRPEAERREGFECDYPSLRSDEDLVAALEDSLHTEQGGLCAYTGMALVLDVGEQRSVGFHIEHLKAQQHCKEGEDTEYKNLVACWPYPNHAFPVPFGAEKKGN